MLFFKLFATPYVHKSHANYIKTCSMQIVCNTSLTTWKQTCGHCVDTNTSFQGLFAIKQFHTSSLYQRNQRDPITISSNIAASPWLALLQGWLGSASCASERALSSSPGRCRSRRGNISRSSSRSRSTSKIFLPLQGQKGTELSRRPSWWRL